MVVVSLFGVADSLEGGGTEVCVGAEADIGSINTEGGSGVVAGSLIVGGDIWQQTRQRILE